ncbi:MAG TPA: hypothetical protein VN328_08040 [Thermodesulfovibrionales bacterium]|nr:hypothetical protein [Thermodesulfovibrionales bacterium]
MLKKLLSPEFLVPAGWIVSLGVAGFFIVYAVLVYRKQAGFDHEDLSAGGRDDAARLPQYASALIYLGLFSLVFISRFSLRDVILGPWFFVDETLDSCIIPFQFSQGESLWNANANYLVYPFYLAAYKLFRFSPDVARFVNILIFAVSTVIVYAAVKELSGRLVGWFVSGLMLVSSPFITHSIYATVITFSLLPVSLLLLLLSRNITPVSAGFLGLLPVAGIFFYPAAFFAGACLLLAHMIFFRQRWTGKTQIISALTFLLAAFSAAKIWQSMTGGSLMQWSKGFLSFKGFDSGIAVVLKDTFLKSLSWDTLNSQAPYFEPELIGFFVIGIAASFMVLRSAGMGGLQEDDRKWVWTGLAVFFGSVILSVLGEPYPGVRRIFPSLVLLLLISGIGLKYALRWRGFRRFAVVALIVCLSLTALKSYGVIRARGQMGAHSNFMDTTKELLQKLPPDQKRTLVINGHPLKDQYQGQQYRCSLSLDRGLSGKFSSVRVIPRADFSREQDVQGSFIFLANEIFSEEQLEKIFRRRPSSSTIIKQAASPEPENLVAVYDFSIAK